MAGTLRMNRARRQFLAAARLARNINGRLAAPNFIDHFTDSQHRRRLADQERSAGCFLLRRAATRRLGRQIQRRLDQCAQLIQRNRLGEVIKRARLQRRNSIVGTAKRRNHGDGRRTIIRSDQAHDFQAIAIGQAHIG